MIRWGRRGYCHITHFCQIQILLSDTPGEGLKDRELFHLTAKKAAKTSESGFLIIPAAQRREHVNNKSSISHYIFQPNLRPCRTRVEMCCSPCNSGQHTASFPCSQATLNKVLHSCCIMRPSLPAMLLNYG